MEKMINNVLGKLDENPALDEIKNALKQECNNITFLVNENDWNYMMTEILYRLAQ